MKHLMLVVFATILSLGTFAQSNTFDNQSSCDLRIRAICIDENACTSSPSTGWLSLPANASTSITSVVTGCTGTLVQGFEVQYDPATTSCTGGYVYTTNPATPCDPHDLYFWPGDTPEMPACSCRGMNPLHIHFDSSNNSFMAN